MRNGRLLLALAAIASFAGPVLAHAQPPQTIAVELSEFKFAPRALILKPHTAYVLQLTDTGSGGHDLAAPEFFKSVTLAPDSAAAVEDGKVEVGKGRTVNIGFTTGDAGSFPMRCTHPGHSLFGMKGIIEVR